MRDHRVVMTVVGALAAVVGVALLGIIGLAWAGKDIPEVLANIATGALGALAALLASTRTSDQPAPVQVVNPPADPVPVAEAPKGRR